MRQETQAICVASHAYWRLRRVDRPSGRVPVSELERRLLTFHGGEGAAVGGRVKLAHEEGDTRCFVRMTQCTEGLTIEIDHGHPPHCNILRCL